MSILPMDQLVSNVICPAWSLERTGTVAFCCDVQSEVLASCVTVQTESLSLLSNSQFHLTCGFESFFNKFLSGQVWSLEIGGLQLILCGG